MTLRTGHIGLNVTELDRSLAFYRDVLGFALIGEGKEEGRRYAFLGDGESLVLTLWQQAGKGFAGDRAGLHHLAFEADSIERVREYEQALRTYGVDFAYEGVVAHREGAASGGIFFHDPDGTRLEISVPSGAQGAPAPVESAPTCGFF
ncbi:MULTISPECIES: VOC family protein [unclassified Streptomyces]|uniref:VOC family protein n=1 Tax=unclassified Streptomyces TaxID=2593676 RepID=UPI00225C291C|nr:MULTISPECIES: VOC family protein [unclassified Streptomyces]MCX5334054.1 VOC family protein [Streptomyces sp. NBC_00140]MCX5363558.1 VOC family protein [Streptomyces sp. NBC_00124]